MMLPLVLAGVGVHHSGMLPVSLLKRESSLLTTYWSESTLIWWNGLAP